MQITWRNLQWEQMDASVEAMGRDAPHLHAVFQSKTSNIPQSNSSRGLCHCIYPDVCVVMHTFSIKEWI